MSFERALSFVLNEEGGVANAKNDHGGLTNHGITQRVYDSWRTSMGDFLRTVREISADEVAAIYQKNYWDAANCGALSENIGIALFDWAVNHGVGGASAMLQDAAGVLPVDGVIGPKSVAAINAQNQELLLSRYLANRLRWYHADVLNNPSQADFLDGWEKRVERLQTFLNVA